MDIENESYLDSKGTEKWALISPKAHRFQKDYYVSSYGRLISKDKKTGNERLLKPNLNKHNGFLYINIPVGYDKKRKKLVHKLVAESFNLPKVKGAEYITHKDGNNFNNQLRNLKYISQEEIINKTLRVPKKKNRIPYSKLDETKVRRLKLQLKRGKIRKAKLARMYNVSDTQIKRIERGENWGHIKV